jgi:hypothetical protein
LKGTSIARAALVRTPLWLGLAGFAAQIALTVFFPSRYQIDLLPYLSARVGGIGLHPWDLYPPYRPLLLAPLASLPPATAYYVFLAARTVILFGVLWLALDLVRADDRRTVMAGSGPLVFFAAFGFNAALGFDLRIGNVATVELLFLLLAFRSLLRGNRTLSTVFILIAGSFKILPFAFLGLLLLPRRPGALRALGIGALGAAALLLVPLAVEPKLLAGARTIACEFSSMRGPVDSSLLALCRDLVRACGGTADRTLTWLTYLTIASGILLASVRTVRQLRGSGRDLRIMISFLVIAYVLIAPRMVTYSFSLALTPFYLLLAETGWAPLAKWLFVAACLPTQQLLWRVLNRAQDAPAGPIRLLPLEYWNWLVILALWLFFLWREHRAHDSAPPDGSHWLSPHARTAGGTQKNA